jgi:hypothetical protein
MSCAYNGKSEINPLKTQRNLFLKKLLSAYRALNTLHLVYKKPIS